MIVQKIHPGKPMRGTYLDGRRLKSEGKTFHPRARYAYWSYIEIKFKQAYSARVKEEAKASNYAGPYVEVARKEIDKKYWSSAGSYIKKGRLLRFVGTQVQVPAGICYG